VASSIVASVRPQDIVCRYGGEEFLVIVHDVDEKGCVAIGERICDGMRSMTVNTRGGAVPATISVGVATRNRGDPISSEHLIALADQALYRSKRDGRDRVSVGRP
jgi:diguanylate cyclase (GGDEF)-like protein